MRKITVTYTLTSRQEERLKEICKHVKSTNMDEYFDYMMNIGALEDVNKKLSIFEDLHNISKADE